MQDVLMSMSEAAHENEIQDSLCLVVTVAMNINTKLN